MQQLLLARVGLKPAELLGYPVTRAGGLCVYLAMDRPAQAARSLRRMVTEDDAPTLATRCAVWKGPLPVNVLERPTTLADWIAGEFPGASDVFVDSLKDLAPQLSDDETGSKLNMARQELIARGLEVVECHHQRKEQRGQGAPKTLADVYGSRWLTAGAGSVVLLWGDPGDPVVELLHLKQPAQEVGPFRVVHDHGSGRSSVFHPVDLEQLAQAYGGVTAKDAAVALYGVAKPSHSQEQKARRRLEALVAKGSVYRDDSTGGLRYLGRRKK
jgi:replicative DNA helicase